MMKKPCSLILLASLLVSQVPAYAGEGAYSVLVVANVDTLTADATLQRIVEAGYEGFIKEGSRDQGFDVHRPGLSAEEARALAAKVKEQVGFATAWETGKLP